MISSVRIVHVKQELELDVWNETMHYTSILSRGNMIVWYCMWLHYTALNPETSPKIEIPPFDTKLHPIITIWTKSVSFLYLLDLLWPWWSKSLSFGSPAAAIFPTSSGQFLLREFDSNGCPCQNFVDVCSMFCQATILICIILYISLSVLSSLLALRSKSDLQCFFNKVKLRSVLFWNKDSRVLASSWKDSSFSKVILARRGIFDTGTTSNNPLALCQFLEFSGSCSATIARLSELELAKPRSAQIGLTVQKLQDAFLVIPVIPKITRHRLAFESLKFPKAHLFRVGLGMPKTCAIRIH